MSADSEGMGAGRATMARELFSRQNFRRAKSKKRASVPMTIAPLGLLRSSGLGQCEISSLHSLSSRSSQRGFIGGGFEMGALRLAGGRRCSRRILHIILVNTPLWIGSRRINILYKMIRERRDAQMRGRNGRGGEGSGEQMAKSESGRRDSPPVQRSKGRKTDAEQSNAHVRTGLQCLDSVHYIVVVVVRCWEGGEWRGGEWRMDALREKLLCFGFCWMTKLVRGGNALTSECAGSTPVHHRLKCSSAIMQALLQNP